MPINTIVLVRLGVAASLVILARLCTLVEVGLRRKTGSGLQLNLASAAAHSSTSTGTSTPPTWHCPRTTWTPPSDCPESMLANRTSVSYFTASTPPPSHLYVNDPSFAIAMIAVGDLLASTTIVMRSVQSIRRRGLFCGPILILSDHADSSHFEALTRTDPLVHPIAVESRKGEMPKKRYKTELLDILDADERYDGITYLLYVDVDILFGEPLAPFVGYVHGMTTLMSQPSRADQVQSYMFMFEEQGFGLERARALEEGNTLFHGGVMVVHRQRSRDCLAVWQMLFDDRERFPKRDQAALYYMLYDSEELKQRCTVVQMDHRPFLLMPTSNIMQAGDSSVFVHVTNGRRSKQIDDVLQADYYRCVMMVDEEHGVKSRFSK